MRILARACLLGAVFVQLVACSDPSGPPPSLSGQWVGTADGRIITLLLADTDGDISGTGSITSPTNALRAAGTLSEGQVLLDVLVGTATFSVFSVEGTLRGDIIMGILNGAGFSGDSIQLSRNQ